MVERKQNGKKQTKHVNNAESKKNKLKIRQKGDNISYMGVETQKNGKVNKDLKAADGWG